MYSMPMQTVVMCMQGHSLALVALNQMIIVQMLLSRWHSKVRQALEEMQGEKALLSQHTAAGGKCGHAAAGRAQLGARNINRCQGEADVAEEGGLSKRSSSRSDDHMPTNHYMGSGSQRSSSDDSMADGEDVTDDEGLDAIDDKEHSQRHSSQGSV